MSNIEAKWVKLNHIDVKWVTLIQIKYGVKAKWVMRVQVIPVTIECIQV